MSMLGINETCVTSMMCGYKCVAQLQAVCGMLSDIDKEDEEKSANGANNSDIASGNKRNSMIKIQLNISAQIVV